MNHGQRAAIVESLTATPPATLVRALRGAGVSARAFDIARAADPELDALATAAERAALPVPWAAAVAASEAAQVTREPTPERPDDGAEKGWVAVRAEAARLFPSEPDPHYRFLLWMNHRRAMAGMHRLDPLWLGSFRDFYASGKPVMVSRKGLRAGGSVSACCAFTCDALDTIREVDPGTILVFPIMSSSRDEATDRFFTIRRMLRACGVAPKKGDDEEAAEVLPGGVGGIYESKRSLSGGGIIALEDSQGHKLEMRILPAMRRAAVGYTGGGFFLDETDLWPADSELHVNPADVVIEDVFKRITTQPTARGYIFSASYYAESAHSRRVDLGDTSAQFLMRLGEEGARRDNEARASLASKIGSTDPRLLAPADPRSPDLPAWVFNPSQSPIARCYQLSDDKLSPMLGLYGGRANENAGVSGADSLAAAKVTTVPTADRAAFADVVIGVAPAGDGSPEWGIVVAGIGASGYVAIADSSAVLTSANAAGLLAVLGAGHRASVLCVAREHEARLNAEVAAALSGLGSYAPPVWAAHVYDGAALRTGPMRSVLDAGRLTVAAGLSGLTRAIAAHRPASRSVRVEALACAVARLVACYPWAAGSAEHAPLRAAPPVATMIGAAPGIQIRSRLAL